MDIFTVIDLHSSDLTDREMRIAKALRKNPEQFVQSTTTMAANYAKVSQATVSRFCQKIGFSSYAEFRTNLIISLTNRQESAAQDTIQEHDPTTYLCSIITATQQAFTPEQLDDIASRIVGARQVYTTGGGLSSPPALSLAMQLQKYSLPTFCIPNGQEMIQMHTATNQDVVVIFSSKNDTQRLFLTYLKELPEQAKPYVMMFGHSPTHPLRKLVNAYYVLPTWQTEGYPVYIEPITSMLALANILVMKAARTLNNKPFELPHV